MDLKNIIKFGTKLSDSQGIKSQIKKILIEIVKENSLQMDETNLTVISNFIVKYFHINLEEVKIAFELFYSGQLEITSDKTQSILTVKLVGIVLNSYNKYRQNILKSSKDFYEKEKILTQGEITEITDHWLITHVLPAWERYDPENSHTFFKDYGNALWNYFKKNEMFEEFLNKSIESKTINNNDIFDSFILNKKKQNQINEIFSHYKKNNLDFEHRILFTI